MIPLRRQVMITTDHVKGSVCRLARSEIPSWPDIEETFEHLRANGAPVGKRDYIG
ncbi:MAG: DUF1993 family protein [Candidatus Devosia symbiotica]|nr:DUF1993 family protein [Candidatus Devosia symbiotica]